MFLNSDLSTFLTDLLNIVIMNSVQTEKMYDIFPKSKTNIVRNLKQAPEVVHVFLCVTCIVFRLINRT